MLVQLGVYFSHQSVQVLLHVGNVFIDEHAQSMAFFPFILENFQ